MKIAEKFKALVLSKEDESNTMIMRDIKYKPVKKRLGTNSECSDSSFD